MKQPRWLCSLSNNNKSGQARPGQGSNNTRDKKSNKTITYRVMMIWSSALRCAPEGQCIFSRKQPLPLEDSVTNALIERLRGYGWNNTTRNTVIEYMKKKSTFSVARMVDELLEKNINDPNAFTPAIGT